MQKKLPLAPVWRRSHAQRTKSRTLEANYLSARMWSKRADQAKLGMYLRYSIAAALADGLC